MLPEKLTKPLATRLIAPNDRQLFSIDLMGTSLSFEIPERTLRDNDFLRSPLADLRPYVNTIAKTEYRYSTRHKRGSCDFFETGWYLYSKKWWNKQNRGMLKLLVSLETPAKDEINDFSNLYIESNLKDWLSIYYRDRQAVMEHASFATMSNGSIEINFHNTGKITGPLSGNAPLNKHPQLVSGMPCYYVYLNPGIIEFNLPIGHSDVLQFRFQIRYLTEDINIKQQLNQVALSFSQQLIETVKIHLSSKEAVQQSTQGLVIEQVTPKLK